MVSLYKNDMSHIIIVVKMVTFYVILELLISI